MGLGCAAQVLGDAIGRFGFPASSTDTGTRLHACMANNHAVTEPIQQHKSVHLQTWHKPNATDSTTHQTDHVLFRRRHIKAVQDIRVGLTLSWITGLWFASCSCISGSQLNIHSILACSQLPFTVKRARKHSSCPCRACRPLMTTYWGCHPKGAQLGSP